MKIDPSGWCDKAVACPSDHYNERPEGMPISLLVIHNISLPAGCFGTGDVDALFCGRLDCCKDPSYADLQGLRVSSHFFIDRSGKLFQYVSCADRAWHAGVSSFRGREGCNDFSIGIELEGTDDLPYEEAQYRTLAELTKALAEAYPLTDVTGHCMIAPERKTDPGKAFDWDVYQSACAAIPRLSFPSKEDAERCSSYKIDVVNN